jgi:serine/threonine-protein kinase RsbW
MTDTKMDEIKLRFNSRTKYIDIVQSISEKLFEITGFDSDKIYWMSIALREAVNNAIKHGNKEDADKMVSIDFQVLSDKLRILVTDEGKGFDAEKIPDPTVGDNIMKAGGRGLFFIKSFMDDLKIIHSDNETGTQIALIKYKEKKPTYGKEE